MNAFFIFVGDYNDFRILSQSCAPLVIMAGFGKMMISVQPLSHRQYRSIWSGLIIYIHCIHHNTSLSSYCTIYT